MAQETREPENSERPATRERDDRRSGGGGGRSGGLVSRQPRRGRFGRRRRVCQFCAEKVTSLDYKEADVLKRYMNEHGKIRSRRETGTCARHQRILARTIKRARHMALLPFAPERKLPN